jgi:hypothetical protein
MAIGWVKSDAHPSQEGDAAAEACRSVRYFHNQLFGIQSAPQDTGDQLARSRGPNYVHLQTSNGKPANGGNRRSSCLTACGQVRAERNVTKDHDRVTCPSCTLIYYGRLSEQPIRGN